MKRILLGLILISFLIVSVSASTQVNYTASKGGVFNGGFETGTGSVGDGSYGWIGSENYGWMKGGTSSYTSGTVLFDANVSHSGSKSLKLVSTSASTLISIMNAPSNPSTGASLGYNSVIRVKPSTTYRYSHWAYVTGGNYQTYIMQYQNVGGSWTYKTYAQPNDTVQSSWNPVNFTFTTGSDIDGIIFNPQFVPTAIGQITYVDDITLEEVVTDTQSTAQQVKPVVQGVTSVDNIDQSYTTAPNTVETVGTMGGTLYAYSGNFTPTKTKFTGINVSKSSTVSTPNQPIVFELRTESGGLPTSTVVASNSFTQSQWDALSNGEQNIPLPAIVTPGVPYTIVFKTTSTSANAYYTFGVKTADGGSGAESSDGGSTWKNLNTVRFYMKTLYAKNTEDVSVTVNGVTANLTTRNITTPIEYIPAGGWLEYAQGIHPASHAFDHDSATYAQAYGTVIFPSPPQRGGILGVDFGTARIINNYTIQIRSDNYVYTPPSQWKVSGSNDNSTWTIVDSRTTTNTTWSGVGEIKTFLFSNTNPYRYYQLRVNWTVDETDKDQWAVAEWNLFRDEDGRDGLLSGAIVDTDKGEYSFRFNITGNSISDNLQSINSIYEISYSVANTAYPTVLNGWRVYPQYLGRGYLANAAGTTTLQNVTWKINTMLPINRIDINETYYAVAGNTVSLSSDGVTFTPLATLSTSGDWNTLSTSTTNYAGNTTIYFRHAKDTSNDYIYINSLTINATLNTTGLPTQSVINGVNYYNISSNGRADSASLDPSMLVNVWLMGQGGDTNSLTANFASNVTGGQVPLAVSFTDSSTNVSAKIDSWSWIFGDQGAGNTSTLQSPTHTYTTNGTYVVNLTVQNTTYSLKSTKLSNIYVNSTLQADFVGTPLTGTAPTEVAFVDYSTGAGIYAWNWTFGDGYVSSLQNPSHTYTSQGSYAVNLTITGLDGTSIKVVPDYIVMKIYPNFTANATISSTYGFPVLFTNTTATVPITAFNWSFGDGYTSTSANPVHFYSVAGKYNVNASFINADGTYLVNKTQYINLTADSDDYLVSWLHMNGAQGSTTFTGEKGIAWTPSGAARITTSTYKFGGASGDFTGSKSYLYTPSESMWNMSTGRGEIEMWVNVTSSSQGVSLVKRGNAAQTAGWGVTHMTNSALSDGWVFWMGNDVTGATGYFTLPINQWTHLVITGDELGTNKVYVNGVLAATKTGMTGNYDTNNPVYIGYRSAPVKYFTGYIDEFRFSSGTTRFSAEFSTPYAEYRGILETIYPDINPSSTLRYKTDPTGMAHIANQTNGGYRNRTVQIQNVTHTNYILGAIPFDSDHEMVTEVNLNKTTWSDMTLLSYTIDNTIGPDDNIQYGLVTFNVTRAAGFEPGTTRGDLIDIKMLYYNYTMPDTDDITTFGSGYLINGTTFKVYPVHNFIYTPLTYDPWVTYSNFSVSNNTPYVRETEVTLIPEMNYTANRFQWDFDDGTTFLSHNGSVTHIFQTPGIKDVTLTAYLWQNNSVTNTTIFTSAVNASWNMSAFAVTADFTASNTTGIKPLPVLFTDTSTGYNAIADAWNWSFGDGTVSSLQSPPVHTYTNNVTYSVNLTIANSTYGLTSTKLSNIIVRNQLPSAEFTASNWTGQPILPVQFTDTSTGDNISVWNWSFGDGTVSSQQVPNLHYYDNGTYSVNLTVGNDGGYSSKLHTVTVSLKSVTADFTLSNTSGILPLPVLFTDSSFGIVANIDTWNWSFGDGTVSSLQNPPVHIYPSHGNYQINLTVTNITEVLESTKLVNISVYNIPPTTDFTASNWSGSPPVIVLFADTTTGANLSAWHWDFDDGTTSDFQFPPVHTFASTGTYHVNLTVTNDGGSTSKTQNIQALGPIAGFNGVPTTGPIPLSVTFTDTSVNTPTTWAWVFGDGGTSALQSPTHSYAVSGVYTVNLTATNAFGSNTLSKTNYIDAGNAPVANFTATPLIGAIPLAVTFTDASSYATSWAWDFNNDGTNESTSQNPTYTYNSVGTYSVKQYVKNSYGEHSLLRAAYIVSGTAPVANFTGTPVYEPHGLGTLAVTFTDSSTYTPTSWAWNFGDGATSILQNPSHTYSALGTYTVTMSASNAYGSNSKARFNYIVLNNDYPVASFSQTPSSGYTPLSVQFTGTSTGLAPLTYSWNFGDGSTSTLQSPGHVFGNVGNNLVTLTVTNSLGSHTASSIVGVNHQASGGGVTPPLWGDVYTDPATSITSRGMTLNGHTNNTGTTPVWFMWGLKSNTYSVTTKSNNVTSPANFTANISSGFYPGKTVYFRAGSTLGYGQELSFVVPSVTMIPTPTFGEHLETIEDANMDPAILASELPKAFTQQMGASEETGTLIFWGFCIMCLFIILYLRSENVTTPALLGMIIGWVVMSYVPGEFRLVGEALLVVALAAMAFTIIKGRIR